MEISSDRDRTVLKKISIRSSSVERQAKKKYSVGDLLLAASYQPPHLYVPKQVREQVRFWIESDFHHYEIPSNRDPKQQKNLVRGVNRFLELPATEFNSKKETFEFIQTQNSYRSKLNDLRRKSKGLVTYFGSHRGNTPEQLEYVQDIAYQNARQNQYGVVTGGGSGMMLAPLEGVNRFNVEESADLPQSGISEPNLLIHEPPNHLVEDFFIYPDIDIRKAGMIEAGDTLVTLEGGVGTIEELIQTLLVLLDPNNADKPYQIHLVYSNEEYFWAIHDLLKAINLPMEVLKKRMTFSLKPKPKILAQVIKRSVEAVLRQKPHVLQTQASYLEYPASAFNEKSDAINDYQTAIASVDFLSTDPLVNLQQTKKLMGLLIDLTAKYRDIVPSWSEADYPVIYGKKPMITAVQKILELMVAQDRMKYPTKDGQPFFRFEVKA